MKRDTTKATKAHTEPDDFGFIEWENPLDQLVSDVIATLEYSPYEWVHALTVGQVEGLEFRGDRFVALGKMVVIMDDPSATEDAMITITKVLTVPQFLSALRKVCAKRRLVIDEETAGEIDADIADQILQTAIYGELVFG